MATSSAASHSGGRTRVCPHGAPQAGRSAIRPRSAWLRCLGWCLALLCVARPPVAAAATPDSPPAPEAVPAAQWLPTANDWLPPVPSAEWLPESAVAPGGDPVLEAGLARGWALSNEPPEAPLDWTTLDAEIAPAGPLEFRMSDDLRDLLPEVRRDLHSLATWRNVLIVGAGAGVSLAIRENLDGEVRAAVAESPGRLGDSERVFNALGDPLWQVPTLIVGYGLSLWRQDAAFHEFMTSTIASYGYTGIAVLTLKGLTDTSRPTDHFEEGRWGFPSFHTASTFAIAANIETWYGWRAGLPALALASLVGYSRIDAQEHDLSDVVFGAVLGYTIGRSVSLSRQARGTDWRVDPWYDPVDSTGGVGLELRY